MNEQDNPVVRMYNKINELARTVERLKRTIGKRPVPNGGTWTPTIDAGTSSPTVSYTAQTGHYIKIGKLVQVSFRIVINTISGGSGQALITGFPFTSENIGYGQLGILDFSGPNLTNTVASVAWQLKTNNTEATIRTSRDNTTVAVEAISIFANGDALLGNGMYRAA